MFQIIHKQGLNNKVVDAVSRYRVTNAYEHLQEKCRIHCLQMDGQMDRMSTEVMKRSYQTPDMKEICEAVNTKQAVMDTFVGQLNWL